MTVHPDSEVDVVGVGFGPANLALAIALREHADAAEQKAVFFEAQEQLSWHSGMLLESSSLQISFLKDLVTMRNPSSPFSFVAFLHEQGRLADFINRGSSEPLRIEFAAYLRWAASRFSDQVSYSTRVESIEPVRAASGIEAFDVVVRSAHGQRRVRARQVVIAAGLQPRLPEGRTTGRRCWHSAQHLHRVGDIDAPRSLVVVGTGQSAMEVVLDLSDRFPGAVVHLVSSQFGVAPSYQGALVNRIFDPESVDLLYNAPPEVRARVDRLHRNSNNAVASDEVITEFYDRMYRDEWLGRRRLVLHRVSTLLEHRHGEDADHVEIRSELEGTVQTVAADAVVYGTGYTALDPAALLTDPALIRRDDAGRPLIRRDHVAELTEPASARLFLIGQSDHLHGLTSPLLSTVAVRAGEIADELSRPDVTRTTTPSWKGTHAHV